MKIKIDLEDVIYRYDGVQGYSDYSYERLLILIDNFKNKIINFFESICIKGIGLSIVFKNPETILYYRDNVVIIINQKRFVLEQLKYIHKNKLKSKIYYY